VSKRTNNPIDQDKITDSPHLLPYAHTLGSAIIKPVDEGKIKGLAMAAMFEQTSEQLNDIKKQIEHLVGKAQKIHNRITISEKIYEAKCSFKPIISQCYFLYKKNENFSLSMISPLEWGERPDLIFVAKVKLLSDHTWKIIDTGKNIEHLIS